MPRAQWEPRIAALLDALPIGKDNRKRIPLLVLLKAIEATPERAIHIAIAAILKAHGYSRTTLRTSIGVISGYISAVPANTPVPEPRSPVAPRKRPVTPKWTRTGKWTHEVK